MAEYIYLGDRNRNPAFRKQPCSAVRNAAGKCIRGKNGNMLVVLSNGVKAVVVARLLRKSLVDPSLLL